MRGTEIENNHTETRAETGPDERRNRGPVMCPRADIREAEDHFSVEIELPGVTAKDVDLQVVEDELRITATRNDPGEAEGNKPAYLIRERRRGAYSRVFRLGALIEREGIVGKMADGVLQIRLPKQKTALPRRIAIN